MRPSDSGVRVGIAGTGYTARGAHIPAWLSLPGARIVALFDSDPEALAAAGRLAPEASRFDDLNSFLQSDLDAVIVCASAAAHFPLALAALEAGKHVLCEKPMGISTAEIRALGAAADARGLVLMAHHQLRFTGPALAAQACVAVGRVGSIYHARVRALRRNRIPTLPGFTDDTLAGGGAVLDLGVHALDMALWLMDFPRAVRVSGAVRTNFAQGDRIAGHWGAWDKQRVSVEDFGTGFVHFENGATLAIECAWLGHFGEEGMDCEWYGSEGNLQWPSGTLITQGESLARETREPSEHPDPYAAAAQAFYEAVAEGNSSPIPWREAAASLSILEALYASARMGREVTPCDF